LKGVYKHIVVTIVIQDLETKEERKLYFKKEYGKSMYSTNKRYVNLKMYMVETGERMKDI
jgi:23S rRNA A2030 N6-methylase RlmJ